MKTLRCLLTATVAFLPLVAAAAPSVKVVAPTRAATINGMLNAAGTASSTAPITVVYYSFNGSPWAAAFGTSVWTVPGLVATPGANVFRAYAVDANSAVSPTNKVAFTYVVNVPLTVLTNGAGTVNPGANGKLLQIGKTYRLTPRPGRGFRFTGWTGSVVTNAQSLRFVMASNLTFTANFTDIARPLCVITSPAAKHSVSNSPLTLQARASDNAAVTAVSFQLNGGGWNAASPAGDGKTWTVSLAPAPGANVVQAFAADAAGNLSLTNTLRFQYVPPPVTGPAPASLAGLVGNVTIEGQGSFEVSFNTSTYAIANSSVDLPRVGNYTYTLLSSNLVQLQTTRLLPPQDSVDAGVQLLTFTNSTTATFLDDFGSNGVVTFSVAPNLAPSPSSIITAQRVGADDNTNIIVLNGGNFIEMDADGNTTGSGTYSVAQFSPLVLMQQLNYTDDINTGMVSYVQLAFSDTNAGSFFSSVFDPLGDPPDYASGGFTILSISNPPAGNAPSSLAGKSVSVTPAGSSTFHICFGANTYSQSAADVNHFNGVGDYTYMKTGADTAQLLLIELEPPGNSSPITVYLTFTGGTSAHFAVTNSDGIATGTFSLASAASLAPASVSGKTLKVTFSGQSDTVVFGTDGTFTHTGSNGSDNSGPYTYAQSSAVGGMCVLQLNAGTNPGTTTYLGLTFSTSSSGTIFVTSLDTLGNVQDMKAGTFQLK